MQEAERAVKDKAIPTTELDGLAPTLGTLSFKTIDKIRTNCIVGMGKQKHMPIKPTTGLYDVGSLLRVLGFCREFATLIMPLTVVFCTELFDRPRSPKRCRIE